MFFGWIPGGLKSGSAGEASGSTLFMYGGFLLPLICDPLWFSIRMIHSVSMLLVMVGGTLAAGPAATIGPRVPSKREALFSCCPYSVVVGLS